MSPVIHASEIEHVALAALKPYEANARTHSDEQVSQLAAIIADSGFTNPLLIDANNVIIAGHGRAKAAKRLGMDVVPCVRVLGLSVAQMRAMRLSDNKLALNAGWDNAMLALEIGELAETDFDMSLLGFSDDEMAGLLVDQTAGLTDPDAVPEAPAEPVTNLGDVWLLGKHRLVCGDSTDADTVAKALNGITPHLMVTDPPYGVEYDPAWRERAGVNTAGAAKGKVLNDDKADWREAWALFPGDVAYVWHAGVHAGSVADSLIATGLLIRSQIVWAKSQMVMSRGDYHWQHEPCWYAVRKGKPGHYAGGRKQTTLWQIDKPRKSETGHSTQKPVECMKRPIENNSSPGQAVYEPFSGSGTTIIAGEMTGRAIHAIELNPAYVDVAVIRWCEFTGQDAMLESTGETFNALREAREIKVAA